MRSPDGVCFRSFAGMISFLLSDGYQSCLSSAALVADLAIVRDFVDSFGLDGNTEIVARERGSQAGSGGARDLALGCPARPALARTHPLSPTEKLASAEAVIAAVPDPLILIDERRRIVRANAQAAAFINITVRSAGSCCRVAQPCGAGSGGCGFARRKSSVIYFSLTVPVERQLRARFARIDHPSPDGAVAVLSLHDITELKRAEQMRADFIANASHELRTPLATLIGFIEKFAGPARGRGSSCSFLEHAGQASRMARLVEDLMSLSRIELNEM